MSDDSTARIPFTLIIGPASKPRGRPVAEERHIAVRLAFLFLTEYHNLPVMKAREEMARRIQFRGEREVRRKLNQAGGVLEAGTLGLIGIGHQQDGKAIPLSLNINPDARCVESNPGEFTFYGSFWHWEGWQLRASYYPKGSTVLLCPEGGELPESWRDRFLLSA